jgi:hypothetical protein
VGLCTYRGIQIHLKHTTHILTLTHKLHSTFSAGSDPTFDDHTQRARQSEHTVGSAKVLNDQPAQSGTSGWSVAKQKTPSGTGKNELPPTCNITRSDIARACDTYTRTNAYAPLCSRSSRRLVYTQDIDNKIYRDARTIIRSCHVWQHMYNNFFTLLSHSLHRKDLHSVCMFSCLLFYCHSKVIVVETAGTGHTTCC